MLLFSMMSFHKVKWKYVLLLSSLLYIILTKNISSWGTFYAETIYPLIACPLSWISGWFPFAIGDLFISGSIIGLLLYPFYARWKFHRRICSIVVHEVVYLLWVYVWFYLAWGLNYYQPNFYERTNIQAIEYSDSALYTFAEQYIKELNQAYVENYVVDKDEIVRLIQKEYTHLDEKLGVRKPFHPGMRPKTMIFSSLASKVGVQGSMGPFFCEYTVSKDLLDLNYPFSIAHELSHVLGITSEAEANFYAYLICTHSSHPVIRYSGYYELLSYVLRNVRIALDKDKYFHLLSQIHPEILRQKQIERKYWIDKYSPLIDKVQNYFYDMFLKQHKVEGGLKNYSNVIGLLLAYEASDSVNS